jgi:hypothetical protein
MARQGTFDARIEQLGRQVGSGTLSGTVERDQPYAQKQHEDLSLHHPQGQAKYQETALHTEHRGYLQELSRSVLHGSLPTTMAEQMEALDRASGQLCPKDLTVLAHSGHPVVHDDGRKVYDRAPEVPRLSNDELAELHRKVRGFTNRPSGES